MIPVRGRTITRGLLRTILVFTSLFLLFSAYAFSSSEYKVYLTPLRINSLLSVNSSLTAKVSNITYYQNNIDKREASVSGNLAASYYFGEGYLWILDDTYVVHKLDLSTGEYVFQFIATGLSQYRGIEFDGTNLWLLGKKDDEKYYMQKYSQAGAYISEVSVHGLQNVYGMAWEGSYFFTGDANATGDYLKKISTGGETTVVSSLWMVGAYDLAYGNNLIWMSSRYLDGTYVFNKNGSLYAQYGLLSRKRMYLIAYAGEYLWTAAGSAVYKFTSAEHEEVLSFTSGLAAIGLTYQGSECSCSTWIDDACGTGGCSSTEIHKVRTCTPSGCSTESKCESDASCTPTCTCGAWTNQGCGGICLSSQLYQTRSCTPYNCDSQLRCLVDSSCSGSCANTDISCGTHPSCANCNDKDGCSGTYYRDYYCSQTSCTYSSDSCSDCSCACGGYNDVESFSNGNCGDNKDNDCDGAKDSLDSGCKGVTCTLNSDCGQGHFLNRKYCNGRYVYDTYVQPRCVNPGTVNSICVNDESPAYITDCLDSYCTGWDKPYCSGDDIYSSKVCYSRGCAEGACYLEQSTEHIFLTQCLLGCAGGRCNSHCINGIKDSNERGVDCGGSCPEKDCCSNGNQDSLTGEEGVDCGPSCKYSCTVPVLLMHGYFSTPDDLSDLEWWLTKKGYTVYNIDYAPYNPLANGDIHQYSISLWDEIENIRQKEHARYVDVVAHSMGGLVTRWYLRSGGEGIRNLIMLGTPNHGSSAFENEKYLFYGLKIMMNPDKYSEMQARVRNFDATIFGQARYQMLPCSTFLHELNYDNYTALCEDRENIWRDRLYKDSLPPGVNHYVIAGALKANPTVLLNGYNDGVVSVLSAYLDNATNTLAPFVNHGGLVRNESVYERIDYILKNSGNVLPKHASMLSSVGAAAVTLQETEREEELLPVSGTLASYGSEQRTVELHDASLVDFIIGSFANISVVISSPTGAFFNVSLCSKGVKCNYTLLGDLQVFSIPSPDEGEWKVRIISFSESKEEYSLFTKIRIKGGIELLNDIRQYKKNNPLTIKANITRDNTPLFAHVSAVIVKPDNSSATIPLYDDGMHNDNSAGDGVYSGSFSDTGDYGLYEVELIAQSQPEQTNFRKKYSTWVIEESDLDLSSLNFSSPNLFESGDTTVSVTVKNIGAETISNATISYFYDSTYGNILIGEDSISVKPHESIISCALWKYLPAGMHTVTAHLSLSQFSRDTNHSNDDISLSAYAVPSERIFLNSFNSFKLNFSTSLSKVLFLRVHKDASVSSARFFIDTYNSSFVVKTPVINYTTFTRPTDSAVPFFTDYDNDGKMDLLMTSYDTSLEFYQNKGTADLPLWKYNDTLDFYLTSYGCPYFIDFDSDGVHEVVEGTLRGAVNYYTYSDTAFGFMWNLNNTFVDDTNQYYRSCPSFVDLDSDGDLDLALGKEALVSYYENMGTMEVPLYVSNDAFLNNVSGLISSPFFIDYDADGDYDLLGNRYGDGAVLYFENTGNRTVPRWTNGTVFKSLSSACYGRMSFADVDNDGDFEFMCFYARTASYYVNKNVPLVRVDVGNDGNAEFNNNGTSLLDISSSVTSYMKSHKAHGGYHYIPIVITADSIGALSISNISISLLPVTSDISFSQGWNLVTASPGILYSSAFYFDALQKKYYPAPTARANTAYWIYNENQTITIREKELSVVEVNLTKGWNLIPYLSIDDILVTESLFSVYGDYTTVLDYDSGSDEWRKYSPEYYSVNTFYSFEPGKSYWIHVEHNQTWTFNTDEGRFYRKQPFYTSCKDGQIRVCGLGIGECRKGIQDCSGGKWRTCTSVLPSAELCDGLDNNCNGIIDEGLAAPDALKQNGVCAGSKKVCKGSSGWGEPDYSTILYYESKEANCDGRDNDCDGFFDNGLIAPNCSKVHGVCKNSKKTCGGSLGWIDCNASSYGQSYQLNESYCDQKDNDCDNLVDEGCVCYNGQKKNCGSNIGECRYGNQTCDINGVWGSCIGSNGPVPDACPYDSKDNDCDGTVDEAYCSANFCFDWQIAPPYPYSEYIANVTYGLYCADKKAWKFNDIDNDGYKEKYMITGETYRIWAYCKANIMYDQNNYVKEFITSNFTYCYDGDCNSISEYYLYEKKYTAPTSALTYPPLYCNVCNGKYCSNYGWDEGTLIWCYDTNSNGQYCDSGDRIEPYLVVKCGVDADCGTGKTCKKPTLENTSTYRCA